MLLINPLIVFAEVVNKATTMLGGFVTKIIRFSLRNNYYCPIF